MPVYLSFLICAISTGSCHITIPVEEPFVGISACQMAGMTMTPQWLEQHPGWTVNRIRCSIGNPPHNEDQARSGPPLATIAAATDMPAIIRR